MMHPALSRAKDIHGERRFYEPGEHPATFRHRTILKQLEQIEQTMSPDRSTAASAAAEYHREKIAEFEAGEHRAKSEYLHRLAPEWP
jgi:hypothetical protein